MAAPTADSFAEVLTMSYSKKFEELRDAARRKAQELDEQFGLRDKLEQGINTASDVARKGVEVAGDAAKAARDQASKLDEQYRVKENLRSTAEQAGEKIRSGAQAAEETAKEMFGNAQGYYRRAEQAYNLGASGARITEATVSGYEKARAWIKNNPGKTAVVTLSLIYGVRAGSALPGLGATILGAGAAGHWFLPSALPIVGIRKVTER